MKVVVASTPKPVNVRRALPFSAAPVAPTGGVYVIVIVQLEPATGGTKVPPALMGVPTAQVPPRVKVPVLVSGVRKINVGMYGPASGFVFGFIVLVIVMVPVTGRVLAGVAVNAGVIGETVIVAIVSWPLSATI